MSLIWADNITPIRRDFSWRSYFWSIQWKKEGKRYELRAEYLSGTNERLAVVYRLKTDKRWRSKVYTIWENPKACLEKTKARFVSYKDGQKWCEEVLKEYME